MNVSAPGRRRDERRDFEPRLKEESARRFNRELEKKYGWLKNYQMPSGCADWKRLGSAEMKRFFESQFDGMGESKFYRLIYPVLHKCQYGYNPRLFDDRPSHRLRKIPRWVLQAFVYFCKHTDFLESPYGVERMVKEQAKEGGDGGAGERAPLPPPRR